MFEHVLHKRFPHLGSKVEDMQKNIYDPRVIFSYDFINREAILHKNIILYIQDVSPKLPFEQVITQLMACQGFTPFLGTKYFDYLHIQRQCVCSVIYEKDSIQSIYDYLETSMAPTILINIIHPANNISPNIF